jgi:hypothetical protein
MRLVDDWKRAHRWITMRVSAGAVALATGWTAVPQEWRDAIPKWVLVLAFAAYALTIMGGRVVKQK